MKKFLPRTKYTSGFTLVELLVVISIIAILSVIGFAVFSSVQQGARDAVRREEVGAMAKALEVNYDNSTAKYIPFATTQFASGAVPVDAYTGLAKCGTGGARLCEYCVRAAAGTAMTKGENGAAACSTNGSKAASALPITDTAFEVCATLEKSPYYYCKTNQR